MRRDADPLQGRRLRILQVAAFPFPSPQGSQVYVRGMARALARRGHAVSLACYGHGQGPEDTEYALIRTPMVPGYRRLRSGPDLVKPWLDAALAMRVAQAEADVVHAHNFEAPLAAALAGLVRPRPLVYNAHTSLKEELPSYFSGRMARGASRRLGAVLDRTVPRLGMASIAISDRNADFLRTNGCPRVHHIPPGVDAEDLHPVAPMPLPPGPWVIYAGNPDRYQDLDVLLAAMQRLPDVGLLLVSASPLAAWNALPLPRVKVVHATEFSDVKRWLAAADVAALPRAVCSGYPIKLLNYLGMGLPTVAAQGSARDMPGVIPVPNHDPVAMAREISDLIAAPERRRALAAAARQHVLQTCLWSHRIIDVERVYADLLRIGD